MNPPMKPSETGITGSRRATSSKSTFSPAPLRSIAERTQNVFHFGDVVLIELGHATFPPRLEVVAQEQNPDGFLAHARHQSSFDSFLGPPAALSSAPNTRADAANHSNNALLLLL